jgi:Clostripain family
LKVAGSRLFVESLTGSPQLNFVVLSGGGFAGYGGDENTARRQLLQTNANIATAIRSSLDAAGFPGKLQVLGFDACLMQAVGAADDYAQIADYIMASEAVEPGHGKFESMQLQLCGIAVS